MQTLQHSNSATKSVHAQHEQPKSIWHRPTLTFVSLQATANSSGSGTDGPGSSPFGADALDDSPLKP